jgi:hypothetical protein
MYDQFGQLLEFSFQETLTFKDLIQNGPELSTRHTALVASDRKQ